MERVTAGFGRSKARELWCLSLLWIIEACRFLLRLQGPVITPPHESTGESERESDQARKQKGKIKRLEGKPIRQERSELALCLSTDPLSSSISC